jgi:hypothetical protein
LLNPALTAHLKTGQTESNVAQCAASARADIDPLPVQQDQIDKIVTNSIRES